MRRGVGLEWGKGTRSDMISNLNHAKQNISPVCRRIVDATWTKSFKANLSISQRPDLPRLSKPIFFNKLFFAPVMRWLGKQTFNIVKYLLQTNGRSFVLYFNFEATSLFLTTDPPRTDFLRLRPAYRRLQVPLTFLHHFLFGFNYVDQSGQSNKNKRE